MLDLIIIIAVIVIACFFLRGFKRIVYFICAFDILLRVLNAIASFYGKYLGNFASFVAKYIPASLPNVIDHYTNGTLTLILMCIYIILFAIFEYYILVYMIKTKRWFMYDFISGRIDSIYSTYVVLENNGIGYKIYTPNPYVFKENDNVKIYVYEYVREDEISLYGFKNLEEREMFLKLIDVKGLGCKMALPMLGLGSVNGLVDAIERENILYLKKFPKIGDKVARQIILDLKGKLVMTKEEKKSNEELEEALKGLGYKAVDINKVIKEVDNSKPIGEQIKDALKLLLKKWK